jgi:hypothetical protein
MTWTYKRGHWRKSDDYPVSARGALARERTRKWGLQARWARFPQLGPLPEKWADDPGAPTERLGHFNEILVGYYLDPISHMLNSPSPLLKYLEAA